MCEGFLPLRRYEQSNIRKLALKKLAYISIIGLIAVSCGKGSEDQDGIQNNADEQNLNSGNSLSSNTEIQEEVMANFVEDIAEFLGGGSNDSASPTALTSASFSGGYVVYGLKKSLDIEKNCVSEEPNKAVVTLELSGTEEHTALNGKASLKRPGNGTRTRTWQAAEGAPESAASCLGKHVAIDWKNSEVVTGLSLNVDVNVNRSEELKIGQVEFTRSMSRTGNRAFYWTAHSFDEESNIYSITKELTVDFSKEFTGRNGNTSVSSNKTLEPLLIEVQRDGENASRISHKVVSGKIEVVKRNGVVITGTYENVLSEEATGCYPISGQIVGERKFNEVLDDGTEQEKIEEFSLVFSKDGNGEAVMTLNVDGQEAELPSFKDFKGFGASFCKQK